VGICGARTRSGGVCCKPTLSGKLRCRWHGGLSTSARTSEGKARQLEALKVGRRRWVERQRLAKAQGLIEKFPNGRKAGVRGRVRSPDPRKARLERTAEATIEMALKRMPVPAEVPPEQLTDAELFADNFRETLLFNREVLKRPIDWSDEKLMDRKERVAQSTQTAAVRIKMAELVPRGDDSVVERLMARVAAIRRGERVIEIEPGDAAGDAVEP
jgi:hypothetical protein